MRCWEGEGASVELVMLPEREYHFTFRRATSSAYHSSVLELGDIFFSPLELMAFDSMTEARSVTVVLWGGQDRCAVAWCRAR